MCLNVYIVRFNDICGLICWQKLKSECKNISHYFLFYKKQHLQVAKSKQRLLKLTVSKLKHICQGTWELANSCRRLLIFSIRLSTVCCVFITLNIYEVSVVKDLKQFKCISNYCQYITSFSSSVKALP